MDLPVRAIFESPTVGELSHIMSLRESCAGVKSSPISRLDQCRPMRIDPPPIEFIVESKVDNSRLVSSERRCFVFRCRLASSDCGSWNSWKER